MKVYIKRFSSLRKYVLALLISVALGFLTYLSVWSLLRFWLNESFQGLTPATGSEIPLSIRQLPLFAACVSGALVFAIISLTSTLILLNRSLNRNQRILNKAIDTANIIIISIDKEGLVKGLNEYAQYFTGYLPEDLVDKTSLFDLMEKDDGDKIKDLIHGVTPNPMGDKFEMTLRIKGGQKMTLFMSFCPKVMKNEPDIYEVIGVDITQRAMAQRILMEKHEELSAVYEELAASEEELKSQLDELIHQKVLLQAKDERHNLVVDASNIGIWDWDIMADTRFFSDKWYEIFELDNTKMEKLRDWQLYILPEDSEKARCAWKEHVDNKTPFYECEYRIKTGQDSIRWVYAVGKGLWNKKGEMVRMAGAHTDITFKKEIEGKISKLAYYDSLTGLANRSRLKEKFQEVSLRTDNISLVFVDMDNFKLINDSYGHAIGDKLLITVSGRLRNLCTANMYAARLSGDEFALLVWDYETDEALIEIVEDIIRHLEAQTRIDDHNISLQVNVGIALYPKDAQTLDELVKNADTALYKAGERMSKYIFYNKRMKNALVERLNMQNNIRLALENEEFVLFYQPQYRSKDQKIVGLEALIRWRTADGTFISPGEFISVAEESKLIIPLGDWVLRKALLFLKELRQRGHTDMLMSVNLSVIQLMQRHFSESVIRILDDYDIPPDCLEFEITESTLMESVNAVMHNLIALNTKGIRIALDDFGTGYSSLNYLTRLPIHTLKIDKSFIDHIGRMKEKGLLIGSIIEIGRNLGLSIVAEGVETRAQFDYLLKKHCERIQGFLFSKPVPANQILELVNMD